MSKCLNVFCTNQCLSYLSLKTIKMAGEGGEGGEGGGEGGGRGGRGGELRPRRCLLTSEYDRAFHHAHLSQSVHDCASDLPRTCRIGSQRCSGEAVVRALWRQRCSCVRMVDYVTFCMCSAPRSAGRGSVLKFLAKKVSTTLPRKLRAAKLISLNRERLKSSPAAAATSSRNTCR